MGKIINSTKRMVLLATLGLCEHCGVLITISDLPADAMDGDWACPKCGKLLGGKTFGYEGEGRDCKKTRWVGPKRKWVSQKPTQEFTLGSWHIIPKTISPIFV